MEIQVRKRYPQQTRNPAIPHFLHLPGQQTVCGEKKIR